MEGATTDKIREEWTNAINEKREEMGKMQKNISSIKVGKTREARNNATTWPTAMEDNAEITAMSEIEKEILCFIKNSKSVYNSSQEEPAMTYYNQNNELYAFDSNDPGKADQFRKWLRKETNRFENVEGNCTINMKLNNLVITNNKEKNLVKIIIILHKTEFSPLGVEMINKSTARIRFSNKDLANKCLNFFETHNKLVSAYIDNREIMYKGIVSDWPKGIPELFEALDCRDKVIKMERLKKRTWNKENNIANLIATDNIVITFRGKNITEYVSIYDKKCFMRVRPFIEAVKQCYNCYKYGHFKRACRNKARCPICGKDAHGECNEPPRCIHCKGNHKSNYKGCLEYRMNKGICEIMAYNNCSYFEADKIIEGKDTTTPLNYDRYIAPQTRPSLPPPLKTANRNKEMERTSRTNSFSKEKKTSYYKRLKTNDRDSDDEQKVNKVRVANKKFANNINERIIRNNIRRTSNSEDERDYNGLAFISNFDESPRNTSFQKETPPSSNDTEKDLYTCIENKDYNDYITKNAPKANKIENAIGYNKNRTRIRLTYRDI